MSELDDAVIRTLGRMLRKLESYLPPTYGVMTWCYNRVGEHLDIITFASNQQSTAETLRLIRATQSKLIQRDAKLGELGEERYFGSAEHDLRGEQLVSSAAVQRTGGHDRVRLWNRGALAGELVVTAGDGAGIAALLGLEERS